MRFRKVRSRKQFVPSRNPGLRCKAVDRNLRLRGFQEQEKLRSNRVEWMKWLVFAVMLIPWPVFAEPACTNGIRVEGVEEHDLHVLNRMVELLRPFHIPDK